jgi:hypothetical protein
MNKLIIVLSCTLLFVAAANAQEQRIVVTIENHKGGASHEITRDDVMASVENQRAKITGWAPANSVGIEFWLLIDDGTDTDLGLQLADLRKFILDQPPTTKIGVGYMRNGTVTAVQGLTSDHSLAAKALRLPVGTPGISASPYMSLEELIHKWPVTDHAREVLMITSGIDPFNGPGPSNPYLSRAIDTAQRSAVVVHSIYYGSSGHFGHSYWQINWGQNFLSQVSEETGGEFYWQGNSNPVSFAPYLKEITAHLKSQFLLTFEAPLASHGFRRVKLSTEIPHATLVSQSRIYEDK